MHKPNGFFIALEGMDGAGKSTIVKDVVAFLKSNECDTVQTREVGGTKFADKVRSLLLDDISADVSDTALALLVSAARRDHVESVIMPALKQGKVVVSDRFSCSTLMYQRKASDIESIVEHGTGGLVPDLTLLLSIDYATYLDRVINRNRTLHGEIIPLDRMDYNSPENFEELLAVMTNYHNTHANTVWIDARGSMEEVRSKVLVAIAKAMRINIPFF